MPIEEGRLSARRALRGDPFLIHALQLAFELLVRDGGLVGHDAGPSHVVAHLTRFPAKREASLRAIGRQCIDRVTYETRDR